MESLEFKNIMESIGFEELKYYSFDEIDSIILKDGSGIYPDWTRMKFMFHNNNIYILHGKLEPYGAKLEGFTDFSSDFKTTMFLPYNSGFNINRKSTLGKEFRLPKQSDMLVLSINNEIISEAMIKDVKLHMNGVFIETYDRLNPKFGLEVSFYDYNDSKSSDSYHMVKGSYNKFVKNNIHKIYRKSFPYNQVIKVKNISNIILSLKSDYNRTYKIGR